jgi:hypothetical protein
MEEARKKERQARVLEALGCKSEKLAVTRVFEAWAFYWEKRREEQQEKLNKNKAMLQYSQFILGKKLKEDSKGLLTSVFAEWERESKIQGHLQQHHQHGLLLDDMRAYVAQLEMQQADLQEQLTVYDQQIDHITETLQQELRTKEELATELREAYNKMRKIHFTPSTASLVERPSMASRPQGNAWSRSSSEQTGDGTRRHGIDPKSDVAGRDGHETPTKKTLGGPPGVPRLPSSLGDLRRDNGESRSNRGTYSTWDVAAPLIEAEGIAQLRAKQWAPSSLLSPSQAQRQSDGLFKLVDRNNDGVISRSEFQRAIQSNIVEDRRS